MKKKPERKVDSLQRTVNAKPREWYGLLNGKDAGSLIVFITKSGAQEMQKHWNKIYEREWTLIRLREAPK